MGLGLGALASLGYVSTAVLSAPLSVVAIPAKQALEDVKALSAAPKEEPISLPALIETSVPAAPVPESTISSQVASAMFGNRDLSWLSEIHMRPHVAASPEAPDTQNSADISLPEAEIELIGPEQEALPRIERRVSSRVRIALVIDDLGLSEARTDRVIELPARMTLAFLPYGQEVRSLTHEAAKAGHEIIVHMPMEPRGPENPGPKALRRGLADEEIQRRVDWSLSQFEGFVGFNNHMGSRATADPKIMSLVMERVAGRGLYFLDSLTTGRSVAARYSRAAGLPTLTRDIFLDHEISARFIDRQLKATEAVARRKGHAIAIGHPHSETIAALARWIPEMEAKGYEFVALSDLITLPGSEDRDKLASRY